MDEVETATAENASEMIDKWTLWEDSCFTSAVDMRTRIENVIPSEGEGQACRIC